MKKLLLFVCSALLIGLTSCSSDEPLVDGGEDNSNTTFKCITKIDSYWKNGILSSSYHYTYDSKGKWIEYLWKDEDEDGHRINNSSLTYSDNTIIQKKYDDENSLTTITYTLNNQNLIISQIGDTYNKNSKWEYKYENGYLKNVHFTYKDEVDVSLELSYTNGNLTTWKESTGRHFSFVYSDIENKSGINISPIATNYVQIPLEPAISIDMMPLVLRGYFGKLSKNLIKEMREENTIYSPTKYIYDYTFNNNGLVDKLFLNNGSNYTVGEYKFYY